MKPLYALYIAAALGALPQSAGAQEVQLGTQPSATQKEDGQKVVDEARKLIGKNKANVDWAKVHQCIADAPNAKALDDAYLVIKPNGDIAFQFATPKRKPEAIKRVTQAVNDCYFTPRLTS